MRRILALFTLIAIVGTACSSDQSETTITDPAGAIAVPDATSGTQEPPTVNLAPGEENVEMKVESTDQRTLLSAFGNTIVLNVADSVGSFEPNPGVQTELWLSAPRWRIDSFGGDECAIANGQIIVSGTEASDLGLVTLNEFGTLANEDIVLAEVPPGAELDFISQAIEAGGLASFHYPTLPQPVWKYGPASAPKPIPDSTQVSKALATTADSVYVIDYFASDVSREIDQEVEEYLNLYDLNLNEDDTTEFTDGLTEANEAIEGHGEFIGGILDRLGVAWEFTHVGLIGDRVSDENAIVDALKIKLTTESGEIMAITNLSMGIEPCEVTLAIGGQVLADADGNPTLITMPPIAIATAMAERARKISGGDPAIDSYLVAAAGNHGSSDKGAGCVSPWFPARFAAGMPAWESYHGALEAASEALEDPATPIDLGALEADIAVLQESTVSVGATALPDPAGGDASRATFSACDDDEITVFAPGTNIISDYENKLAVWSGTSFAAPQVAGAIARGFYDPTPTP